MASREETERRRYALLQAAAIIFAKDFNGVPSDEDFDLAVDCAENLLVIVERIDNMSVEDKALQSDLLDFIGAGGKAGRTQDEILDHFVSGRDNTTKR